MARNARNYGVPSSVCATTLGRTSVNSARQVSVLLDSLLTGIRIISKFKRLFENYLISTSQFADINEKALTFITRESFLMRNYINTPAATPPFLPAAYSIYGINEERDILKGILAQDILINLRTYDANALVLYANDHYNNFVHLYISSGREIVFLYNYGDAIVNLTIVDVSVSSLNSIQVAIEREEQRTTMHVNEQSVSVDRGMLLLDEYSNKPWVNPDKGNYINLWSMRFRLW